ncbi:hypothetical protein ACLKMY_36415 [Paraburkholderia mimosarum]|uniref:hypothetical protein n=2 Tax=Paraburkholderia mimosarum TaxID=312026 RepID=UPI0006872431|nr:hypothetical protein [Paraburkholderia mimosarum]
MLSPLQVMLSNHPARNGAEMKKTNGECFQVGCTMSNLIDLEIEHIQHAISISIELVGPVFPATYWRQRLHSLLGTGHVNKGQLGKIDSLLLMLDLHELNGSGANR